MRCDAAGCTPLLPTRVRLALEDGLFSEFRLICCGCCVELDEEVGAVRCEPLLRFVGFCCGWPLLLAEDLLALVLAENLVRCSL